MISFFFKQKNIKAYNIKKIIKEEYKTNISIKAIEKQLEFMGKEENLNVLAKQIYDNVKSIPIG